MRFITKHQLQEEFSILQVISEINSTAVRVIHRFVSSHLTSSILLSRGLSSGEKALMRPNWGETKLSRPSNRSWRTGRNRGGRRPGREPRGGRRIPWEIRFKYHVEEGGTEDDIWPLLPGRLLCWCTEEHGSDDGRARCQDGREREVQVVDFLCLMNDDNWMVQTRQVSVLRHGGGRHGRVLHCSGEVTEEEERDESKA